MQFSERALLAPYTTFKIGGPADLFCEVENSVDLINAVRFAQGKGIPYFLLGGGSNILVSDKGFRGLVIKNVSKNHELRIMDGRKLRTALELGPRLEQVDEENFYIFEDLLDKEQGQPVLVEVDSGFNLEELAKLLFDQNVVGLEYFAGVPGTVGGAIYGNSHGGTKYFGEYVAGARVLTRSGEILEVDQEFLAFGYDRSSLQENNAVVLSVVLQLNRGDGIRARRVFETWKERKIRQPKRSAGCVFQNLSKEEQERLQIPITPKVGEGSRAKREVLTNSVGFIIDQLLGLKGKRIGDAEISSYHGAFIINRGNASSSDVRELIELCKTETQTKLGLELHEEITYVGF